LTPPCWFTNILRYFKKYDTHGRSSLRQLV